MAAFLFIALIVIAILWYYNHQKLEATIKKQVDEFNLQRASLEKEKTELQLKNKTLEDRIKELSKYQGVVDAYKKAKEILEVAESNAQSLIANAKLELEVITTKSRDTRLEATREAQAIKTKAETVLNDALVSAKKIIDDAHQKAEQVAGNAYKAMQNVEAYEKSLKAIKNIINGYDNQYLVPTYSLLDELADEFGHVEAGEQLKRVREQIRVMVKNRLAGKCDYAETNRRDTAIDFVVDAFNGKVDTILTTVKRDNYGTLEQKIKDSFQVVNLNGQAFRNAVITENFLSIRLEELKWAVILNELKFQEKEEQRIIKERIREEEKAKREYEKAIKEAEKEEEMLRKAIEKAQKEVAKASEAQKAEYESQLQGLLNKLKEAEEKNQRAISMAQQTKAGNVYIISNIGSFGEDVFKIGMTRRLEPLDRVRELGDASVPFEFDVHAMIYSEDAPKLENELHKKFIQTQLNKVNPRKEFFKIGLTEIKKEIEVLGIQAKWTLTAEAREYRESLAIAQVIMADDAKKAEWLKHQLEVSESDMEDELIES